MSTLDDILSDGEHEKLDPTLLNIVNDKELQWIFVGGKGGVGKSMKFYSIHYNSDHFFIHRSIIVKSA